MRYIILLIILSSITIFSQFLSGILHALQEPSYVLIITGLLIGIFIILGGCELFANGVECFGKRFSMSHSTVGGLLAAVGTALPETMVPILALLFGHKDHSEGIAVGAILGAPFMLSTLAMFLLGLTVCLHWFLKKRPRPYLNIQIKALTFEMRYFILIMTAVLVISLIRNPILNHITAILLLIVYGLFVYFTLRHEPEEGEEFTEKFHFAFFLGCPRQFRWIVLQILIGLFFIVIGAYVFIEFLTVFSMKTGISSLVLSLLITPVATELPEKFNSITWTLKGRDTIGFANLSGAMVFQATIPVSIGLLFTDWLLSSSEILIIFSALLMGSIIMVFVSFKRVLPAWLLLTGGAFYLFHIVRIFSL
jgi:cation:H+ antiporter